MSQHEQTPDTAESVQADQEAPLIEAPPTLPDPLSVGEIARRLLENPGVEIGAVITDVGVLVTILIPNEYVSIQPDEVTDAEEVQDAS